VVCVSIAVQFWPPEVQLGNMRVFGYSEEDAVGQPLGALIALDDPLEELETHTSTASAQSEVVIPETVRRRNDGTRIPVSFVKIPVRSPRTANYWYLIYRDLTERKRLEYELGRERDRLRLLLEITHSMTSKLDPRQLIGALSMDLLSVMQCDFCALLLPDADNVELRVTTLYNPEARGPLRRNDYSHSRFDLWQSILDFEEVRYDPESFGNEVGRHFYQRVMAEGLVSGCDLPLTGRNGVVGVLAALKRSERAYGRDDVVFLEQVARQVAIAVENALEYGKAIEDKDKEIAQKRYLQEEIRAERNFDAIVGESPALKAAMHLVSVVAPTDSSVLVLGETGTGKELIARAIHDLSTTGATGPSSK
jgi:PAS domain S-box-containing protein